MFYDYIFTNCQIVGKMLGVYSKILQQLYLEFRQAHDTVLKVQPLTDYYSVNGSTMHWYGFMLMLVFAHDIDIVGSSIVPVKYVFLNTQVELMELDELR